MDDICVELEKAIYENECMNIEEMGCGATRDDVYECVKSELDLMIEFIRDWLDLD